MRDLLNKLLPSRPSQSGTLPKYSAKKRNKLITFGIIGAIAITAGVYLFITFNPLKSSITTLAETPEIAFSQLHKHIKSGNRKEIISRLSSDFKGGAVQKREIIKALGTLKGTNYTIKKELSKSKGNIHIFTYSLSLNDKSITLSDETWQKNPDENKWYLLKEGKNFQQIVSLTSGVAIDTDKSTASAQTFSEVEKTIPEGVSLLTSVKGLKNSHQKIKNTAFYKEIRKTVIKKGTSSTELTLIETAITSLFGENVVYAHYGKSKNYLAVSKLSSSIKLLSPIAEKVLKLSNKEIKITSSKFGEATIKTVVSGKNKAFFAFSKTFLHISDSELLLKNSLQLAYKKKEESILNNTEIFTFLTDLRSDYKYYLLGSYSDKTVPDFFNYGYFEGNVLQSITTTNKAVKSVISQRLIANAKNTFNGKESLFDIVPDDKYGFLAFTLDLTANSNKGKGFDFNQGIKIFEESTGLKVKETFTSKVLFTILSGSGTNINDFFFPVLITETKDKMAEKSLIAISKKFNLAISGDEGVKYITYNLTPEIDVVTSAINNNLVTTLGVPGFKKVLHASQNKYPNIKSNEKWNYFFGGKPSAKLIYSFNIDAFFNTFAEIYARSNLKLLEGQQISKLESIDALNFLGVLRNISGKAEVVEGAFVDKGRLVFGDIDPVKLSAQTNNYLKKSDLDLQSIFASQMSQNSKIFAPGTSTRLSSGIVAERKIEGFIYVSRRKRDPFAPTYMISQANYERESQGKRDAESLFKEIEKESLQLEDEFLKPISFDALLLDLIKTNDPEEYQNIVKYAKLFENGGSVNLETFEEHKKAIFAYNDLFHALKNKFEEDYLDMNKLPYQSLSVLELKGVATGALGSKALIVAGDQGYFINEGDYISSEFYLVDTISNNNIQLMKKSFDYKLSPTTQEQTLSINKLQ